MASNWRDGDCTGVQVHFPPTRFETCSGIEGALSSMRFSSAAHFFKKSVELAYRSSGAAPTLRESAGATRYI